MGERSLLVGRRRERSQIDALFADADSDRSRVLVLRGEPGVGETALINYALRSTADLRVVQTVGVESEADLAFAALHQLCISSLDYLSRLPEPQREALEVAFGLKAGTSEDRLLMVGLATLTLFSVMASEQPLLCAVDDSQWVDRESARALAFVARRLITEPIVILFATRDDHDDLQDLPELIVEGLEEADASELLSSVVSSPLNARLRGRFIAETGGNPLALLELPKGLTAAELDFGFGSPSYVPLSRKIEETFGRRISGLPLETQQWLLLSAAGYLGDAATIWGAAENLGISENAADAADAAGLLEVGSSVRFAILWCALLSIDQRHLECAELHIRPWRTRPTPRSTRSPGLASGSGDVPAQRSNSRRTRTFGRASTEAERIERGRCLTRSVCRTHT